MKLKKILTHSLEFALSNIYLKIIIKCLEQKIFKEKAEVLFYKIKKSNRTFSLYMYS